MLETNLVTCKGRFLILQKSMHSREGWDAGEGRKGATAKVVPSERGQTFLKLGLLWECRFWGPPWRWQLAPKGRELCGLRVLESPLAVPLPASLTCLPLLPPFPRLLEQQAEELQCETGPHATPATLPVTVWFGATERRLQHSQFEYTSDPNVTSAGPAKSFLRCWAKGMWQGALCMSGAGGLCRALLLVGRGAVKSGSHKP